jgi:hypothetical protein
MADPVKKKKKRVGVGLAGIWIFSYENAKKES